MYVDIPALWYLFSSSLNVCTEMFFLLFIFSVSSSFGCLASVTPFARFASDSIFAVSNIVFSAFFP